MSRRIVVVISQLTEQHRTAIRAAAAAHGFEAAFYPNNAAALPVLGDAEIVFGAGPDLTKNAPALRWFCTPQAGVNQYVAPDAFASPDAVLTNSSGAYGTTIAEHILMVTLEMMRRQQEYTDIVHRRDWKRDLRIRSIRDSRVTLLGTGDIGQETVRRLRGFLPKAVVGVNRSGRNPGNLFDRVVTQDHLDAVLPDTDLLIMSLPGTKETDRLMNRARLSLLPRDTFLINVGRGNAMDEGALEELLRAGHLSGAALDVFEREPLPADATLWDCPRLLITPHVAGNMTLDYTVDKIVRLFLEDFENYCAGRPLLRQVDRAVGY